MNWNVLWPFLKSSKVSYALRVHLLYALKNAFAQTKEPKINWKTFSVRCALGAGQSQIRRLIQNANQKRIITVFIGQRLGWQRMRFSFYLLATQLPAVWCLATWLLAPPIATFVLSSLSSFFFRSFVCFVVGACRSLIKCAWPLFWLLLLLFALRKSE